MPLMATKATVELSPATKAVGNDCVCERTGAAVSALAGDNVEVDCAASDGVEVGRDPGMLVNEVGRFVMKDPIVETPARATDVDVMVPVVVLGPATDCVVDDGCRADDSVPATDELDVVVAALLIDDDNDDDVVAIGPPTLGRRGETRLLKPLIPSHKRLLGSVHRSDMIMYCCH